MAGVWWACMWKGVGYRLQHSTAIPPIGLFRDYSHKNMLAGIYKSSTHFRLLKAANWLSLPTICRL